MYTAGIIFLYYVHDVLLYMYHLGMYMKYTTLCSLKNDKWVIIIFFYLFFQWLPDLQYATLQYDQYDQYTNTTFKAVTVFLYFFN